MSLPLLSTHEPPFILNQHAVGHVISENFTKEGSLKPEFYVSPKNLVKGNAEIVTSNSSDLILNDRCFYVGIESNFVKRLVYYIMKANSMSYASVVMNKSFLS